MKSLYFFICSLLLLGTFACKQDPAAPKKNTPPTPAVALPSKAAPFDAQRAYDYVKKQVDFGSRVPGTSAHKKCAEWLEKELRQLADSVQIQKSEVTIMGKNAPMYNIIASFNPQATYRIMLSAHWDSRMIADQDDERQKEAILGANDGASGVAVLLEIAQQLKNTPLKNIGVDMMLWDAEDNGFEGEGWCLGSQYWAKNPHRAGYRANYGILLDMVGSRDAVFCQEGVSRAYAPHILKKVWETGNAIGHSSYFAFRAVNEIIDDHLYINQIANIPTIDIIQYDPQTYVKGFGDFWHTHEDNINIIEQRTLRAVGETVLTVIYHDDTVAL